MNFKSKLPETPTSIFTRMSQLAQEYEALNLAQGFPDFETDPHLIDLVTKYMKLGFNQYAPMPGNLLLRERIANKYSSLYDLNINPVDEVTITAGGTQGLFTVISTVVSLGDEVIIFEPAYDSYKPAVELMGGKVITVKLLAPDFEIDWSIVRSLITDRTKMIILNNPNNPTGRILNGTDINELENIVIKNDLLVLSDEVYEHIIFDDKRHLSALSSSVLRDRTFVVCSFGKLLHTTGWKVGYVIAAPLLTSEFRKVHQFNVFSVNTPMQMAIADYLDNTAYYDTLSTFFQGKRDYMIKELCDTRFKLLPCEGTYFMLLDYSDISSEDELSFAERLTRELGLAMIPVSAFYTDTVNQNLLRICFAKDDNTLFRAVDILKSI